MVLDNWHFRPEHHDESSPRPFSQALYESLTARGMLDALQRVASECAQADAKCRELLKEVSSQRHIRSLVSSVIAKLKNPKKKAHPGKLPPSEESLQIMASLALQSVEDLLEQSKQLKTSIIKLETELETVAHTRDTALSQLPNIVAEPLKFEVVSQGMKSTNNATSEQFWTESFSRMREYHNTDEFLSSFRGKWLMSSEPSTLSYAVSKGQQHVAIMCISDPDAENSMACYQQVLNKALSLVMDIASIGSSPTCTCERCTMLLDKPEDLVKLEACDPSSLNFAGAFGTTIKCRNPDGSWSTIATVEHTLDYVARDWSIRFGPKKMLQASGTFAHLITGTVHLHKLESTHPCHTGNDTLMQIPILKVIQEKSESKKNKTTMESIEMLLHLEKLTENDLIQMEETLSSKSYLNGFVMGSLEPQVASILHKQIDLVQPVQYPNVWRWYSHLYKN